MPRSRLPVFALAAALLAAPAAPRAQEVFSFDPQAIEALQERALVAAGQLLHNAILQSRHEAIRAGVRPLPTAIRVQLAGYFPDELLDRVRYRVGGGSDLSLQLNVIRYGDQAAITLGDVVVFAREGDAQANAALWAHELWHVRQSQEWGLEAFAQRYAHDYRAVELEAETAAARYAAWAQARAASLR